jgi:hypothetical protein
MIALSADSSRSGISGYWIAAAVLLMFGLSAKGLTVAIRRRAD